MCEQKGADGVQRDAGRLWCRHVPGHRHDPHGNAEDPAPGRWQAW